MRSGKKSVIFGAVAVAILVVSVGAYFAVMPHESVHVAFLSKSQAHQISGENYTTTIITITKGSNLSGGEIFTETVQYSGTSLGYLLEGVYEFNNTSSANNLHNYMASSLYFGVHPSPFNVAAPGNPVSNSGSQFPTTDTNATANMTYKGFNYTYLLKPELINSVGSPYYLWDSCGVSGNFVFGLWGTSSNSPNVNMSFFSREQINMML